MATKNVSKTNGLILRGFRKQNKISAKELGSSLRRSEKTVYGWEGGKNIPDSIKSTLSNLYGIDFKSSKGKSVSKSSKSVSRKSSKVKSVTVGEKFVSYMRSTGLSVVEFCSKYDMSPASVYRVINGVGEHYVSFKTLRKLSKDVDINSIFS